jgi:acetoin utilization protein AcuC
MRPTRLRLVYELLEAYGAFRKTALVPPRMATPEELQWFHDREYVEAVASISRGEQSFSPERYHFSAHGDNPPYEGMYEASALSTGGSLVAAELVAEGRADAAFNVSGGLHHAMQGYASGFCIFNDPVIAIELLRRRGLRCAYIDIDCHYGDGVQAAYYATDEVLTISLHESGRFLFPGTGEVEEIGAGRGKGYSVNVPLGPYTDDATYAWAFEQVVPPVLAAFKPDVLVTQLGMDTHFNDPLTHGGMTVEGHGRIVKRLGELTKRWVALGGGGYDLAAVARGWTLDYGVMAGVEWPDEIPGPFREQYGIAKLRDGASPIDEATRKQARQFAEASVAKVRRLIFPVHGIS